MALAGLIHSLVCSLSDEIDQGAYQHDCHPMLVRQNLWRAERFGLDARLIHSLTHEAIPAREAIRMLVDELEPKAADLACSTSLERIREMAAGPTWAERQLEKYAAAGDPAKYVRRAVAEAGARL